LQHLSTPVHLIQNAMPRASIVLYFELQPSASPAAVKKWIRYLESNIPGCNSVCRLVASDTTSDEKSYAKELLIDVQDGDAITAELVDSWRAVGADVLKYSDWIIYQEISRDYRKGLSADQYPPTNTELVQVGMAPSKESVEDYHKWFNEEHLDMLADVPGWRSGSRFQLLKRFGDNREHASIFMSANEYDEENGLGGPIWKKSIDTPWTKRVTENLYEPNHRRTWKYVQLDA